MTIPFPASDSSILPYDAEADAILLQALPETIASLVTLSRSPNRCTAWQALKMLWRYLHDRRSIAITATLGPDAARVHLAAIALVEGRKAELTGGKRIPHVPDCWEFSSPTVDQSVSSSFTYA